MNVSCEGALTPMEVRSATEKLFVDVDRAEYSISYSDFAIRRKSATSLKNWRCGMRHIASLKSYDTVEELRFAWNTVHNLLERSMTSVSLLEDLQIGLEMENSFPPLLVNHNISSTEFITPFVLGSV